MATPIKIGILQFPGTNCDYDAFHATQKVFDMETKMLWHTERLGKSADYQCLILPGGFAYGDYLRAGSMAMLSPIMEDVVNFANAGGLLLGICNGFQVLTELKLLPGALLTNNSLNFECRDIFMRVENHQTPFSCSASKGEVLRMPIAHQQGCYYIDQAGLKELQTNQQIVLRYCTPHGEITAESNPNGSLDAIAGICNSKKNVFGLMPHPERCAEALLGNTDGKVIFASIQKYLN
jgi:phosphoribosylformylglycinamidine synthase